MNVPDSLTPAGAGAPARCTIPPFIHVAGILLLVTITVVCGPLSAFIT